jgi:uncharacterized circularly permuted ATP-grasp superfamily protein/uncharacterized alpha-E superfamily protein
MSTPRRTGTAARDQALLAGYEPHAEAHDEMLGRDGEPRPHWEKLVRGLQDLTPDDMARRWERARRVIRDNGVTYNVYGDPRGMDRPWHLDAVPLLVSAAEWRRLAAGIEQRAELLNLVLADLYGPQRLLRERQLPPELVFAHPGFLRPCHGMVPPERRHLHLYAADLARAPDGRFWVLGDRTQAPSGAGYALENRLALSRSLAELFRDCHVARLAAFFASLRATLARLAPGHRDNPRIVLLTPGPYNETYFEHAYLARYLGFGLVEGGDLTVRDGVVYLKTLEGLRPVDVILRRLDDDFCDPLSLRGDSSLGVPGLVQAVRAGTVVVANALGSGLVESPALLAFLPALCRHLLGEEPKLESAATWWCGDPAALTYVEDHLERLVVKPAFPGTGMEPVFGERLAAAERGTLLARLRARPHAFVAQEQVMLSTAPTWEDGRLQPRHVTLRTFAVATASGYGVMPGGLTRVADAHDPLVVSMQRGGGSKDVWVLADGPVPAFSLLRPPGESVELSRGGNELPSRVGDGLFWLGRYLARAEGTVRLHRAILRRIASESDPGASPGLPALLDALTAAVALPEPLVPPADVVDGAVLERALAELARADEPERALRPTVAAAHRLAAIVRDRITPDTWRVLTELERGLAALAAPAGPAIGETLDVLDRLVLAFAAFGGLATDGMTRTQGWRFTDMGRRLERTLHVVDLLRATLVEPRADEAAALDAVLDVADSSVTYRRRYLGAALAEPVLDLLLVDETNPRGVVFQLGVLEEHVRHLPRAEAAPFRSPEERLAAGALARVRLADVERLAVVGPDGTRDALGVLLASLADDLPALADVLTSRYLSHAQPARRLGDA